MGKGGLVIGLAVIVVVGLCFMSASAMIAGTTTKVEQSRAQAQVAQSRAIEAEQVARQEEARTRQSIEQLYSAHTQADTLAMIAYNGEKRDNEILDAFLDLAMEDYEARRTEQSMKHIYLIIAISIAAYLVITYAVDKMDTGYYPRISK